MGTKVWQPGLISSHSSFQDRGVWWWVWWPGIVNLGPYHSRSPWNIGKKVCNWDTTDPSKALTKGFGCVRLSVIRQESKCSLDALAGVAQLVECHPANQKIASLVPGQGLRLDCRSGPSRLGHVRRATQLMFLSHINISPPLFLPPFPLL